MQVRAERIERTMAATGMDAMQAYYVERDRNVINSALRSNPRAFDRRFDSAEAECPAFAARLRAVAMFNLGLEG